MVASKLAHDTIQKEVAEIWGGGAHIYKFCMISLEGNVCPHVTYKHTMVNIFSGSTAKAKRQESEGEQQTVLHNAQEVKFGELQFRSQTPLCSIADRKGQRDQLKNMEGESCLHSGGCARAGLASFPGLPQLQFLIACSMLCILQAIKNWKRSKTGAGERPGNGPGENI